MVASISLKRHAEGALEGPSTNKEIKPAVSSPAAQVAQRVLTNQRVECVRELDGPSMWYFDDAIEATHEGFSIRDPASARVRHTSQARFISKLFDTAMGWLGIEVLSYLPLEEIPDFKSVNQFVNQFLSAMGNRAMRSAVLKQFQFIKSLNDSDIYCTYEPIFDMISGMPPDEGSDDEDFQELTEDYLKDDGLGEDAELYNEFHMVNFLRPCKYAVNVTHFDMVGKHGQSDSVSSDYKVYIFRLCPNLKSVRYWDHDLGGAVTVSGDALEQLKLRVRALYSEQELARIEKKCKFL